MKILKTVIRCIGIINLAVWMVTGDVVVAIILLAFGSMSLGILIGEKIDGGRNYGGTKN